MSEIKRYLETLPTFPSLSINICLNVRKETSFLAVDGEGNISWEARRDMSTGRDEHGCSQVDSDLIENLESDSGLWIYG